MFPKLSGRAYLSRTLPTSKGHQVKYGHPREGVKTIWYHCQALQLITSVYKICLNSNSGRGKYRMFKGRIKEKYKELGSKEMV